MKTYKTTQKKKCVIFTIVTIAVLLMLFFFQRWYTSREIESVCKTDIRFMWLLNGEPTPSDSTIARFMRGQVNGAIEGLFYQFVEKVYEMGEVKFIY